MHSRSDENDCSPRLPVAQLLLGCTVTLAILALLALYLDRGGLEPAQRPSFSTVAHSPMPVIDVVVVGDSSIAVTNPGGWTQDQVRTYLSVLKKARAHGALASVGIPAPSTRRGYEEGVVYLIDGHPAPDLLRQFARKEAPGYALIAPSVRGMYQWPPDRLIVGFSPEASSTRGSDHKLAANPLTSP